MQNPSVVLHGPGKASIEDRPLPRIERDDDVIVRIAYTGVCGSDVHFWVHGGINAASSISSPLVMGHEASGIVHEVGKGVTSVRKGDAVAIEPGYPCRRCLFCKDGRYNLCRKMMFAAAKQPMCDGTLARYFKIPADFVYKLDDDGEEQHISSSSSSKLSLQEGVLMEPLAVAVHSVREVDVRPGHRVLVLGAGSVGIFCAAVAREFGASHVVLVDVNEKKLVFARDFLGGSGARIDTFVPGEDIEQNVDQLVRLLDASAGSAAGYDVTIEATGAQPCIQMGILALRPRGGFIQTGLGRKTVEFPIAAVSIGEIHVRGCFRYGPGDFQLALQLARAGKVPVKKLISRVFPFEQTTEAWENTRRGEGIKNLIQVD
ncbi:hypothetical protein ASPZODRAFT_133133 [Penicilliopsis zonata CBS 506.65]|uniref:D-xylulose reductase n=1 Tax=Penicilliopsis zonata CBS 506.65 TaxID=1073090 RepID=A0A1L9SFS6_9EURO|nr:hypothetical protein ASPZODRAFT_133133 [Penicilliopsis zonata CBS 506.65]OJJ46135.1 hypothetical protein ASPZODRAFT_133133 [Penicilliopsis zonata CBS 506.65]